MNKILSAMQEIINSNAMLSHAFYIQYITDGIPMPVMRYYVKQWHHIEKHFTRFTSNAHAQCDNLEARQVFAENMFEEDGNEARNARSHLSMWINHAEGIGCSYEELISAQPHRHTRQCVDSYFDICKNYGWKAGVCAMYAYEYQAPKISETKKHSLITQYNITSDKALEFWTVHEKADVWHSQQWEAIINKHFKDDDLRFAAEITERASRALYTFLDGSLEYLNQYNQNLASVSSTC